MQEIMNNLARSNTQTLRALIEVKKVSQYKKYGSSTKCVHVGTDADPN